MSKKKSDLNDFFYLKPKLTFAMKLAASFALTYYVMMFLYYILAVVFYRYSIDFYYLGKQSVYQNQYIDVIVLVSGLVLSLIMVVSLILILCKKTYGKAIFVVTTLILVVYQLITTSFHPWLKYALEILMMLVTTPIHTKKIMGKIPPADDKTDGESSQSDTPEKESVAETDTETVTGGETETETGTEAVAEQETVPETVPTT